MIKFDTKDFFSGIMDDIKESKINAPKLINAIGFEAWRGLKSTSPVKEGIFRGNWRANINHDDTGYDKGKKDYAGSEPYPISAVKVGDEISITNALPYADPLDAGSSAQARSGVTTPVAKKIEARLRSMT